MKRKVANPDINKKKKKQAAEKVQNQDLKKELENEKLTSIKKMSKNRPQMGHK